MQIFSGHLNASDGMSAPVSFDGPSGWTVYKMQQTEVYQVRHNLNLSNPSAQFHVTVTGMTTWALPIVQSMSADTFNIVCRRSDNGGAMESDLMFVAVYNP